MQTKETIDIVLDIDDLDDNASSQTLARVIVRNKKKGTVAVAFFSVRGVNSRPKFTLTATKNPNHETIVHATPDWIPERKAVSR